MLNNLKHIYLILSLLILSGLNAQVKVNVSILGNQVKNQIEINVVQGHYTLSSEGHYIRQMYKGQTFMVHAFNHQILTEKKDRKYFKKSYFLRVDAQDDESVFQIRSINGKACDYRYKGAILITADDDELKIINILDLDDYLVGVLKAEVGHLNDPEFLKSMAVISRTYTLRNLGKNLDQGFDLTDQVDCQVYMGVNHLEEKIVQAVEATSQEVIMDTSDHFIDALFHSNSGGLTSRSSFVWSKDLDYICEVEDSFSKCGKNYEWSYRIPKNEWHRFLLHQLDSIPEDYLIAREFDRRKYWQDGDSTILMKDIRTHFKLRSALFNIEEEGDSVWFRGRGYGHGVGMSQEGAYEMSLQGFSYEDIILFYYRNIRIGCLGDSTIQIQELFPKMNQSNNNRLK